MTKLSNTQPQMEGRVGRQLGTLDHGLEVKIDNG